MNKDDMDDDAEFEAFLKGEGSLARQLQSLPQPVSPKALDAAILQHARSAAGMAARPAAANDAGDNPPASVRPPGLSWRWRIPAGIAAMLLVGVIARQSFEADPGMAAYETTVAQAPAAEAPAAQAPAPSIEVARPQPPPPPETARKPAPPARPVMRGSPPPAVAVAEPAPVFDIPAPAPAPAPPAAPAPGENVSIMASRARVEAKAPADEGGQAQFHAELETQQRKAAPSRKLQYARTENQPAPAVAAAPPPPPAPAAAPASGAELLRHLESLLDAGREREALAAWERLRQAYPDFPVPDTTREKLRQIQ